MKKKVLYVLQGLGMGGVSSVVLNYYRMFQSEVKADFVVFVPYESIPEQIRQELEKNGCNIYHVTPFITSMRKNRQEVSRVIREGNYDIVHDNDKYFAFLSLKPAKKNGVPKRICHVHNMIAASEKGLFHRLFIKIASKLSMRYATTLLSCSNEAGRSMYGNHHFIVLNNAIDPEHFVYSEKKRKYWRESLGLQDSFVIIMVARKDPLKRYDFAFRVFHELHKLRKNVAFMVVGMNETECYGRDKEVLNSLPEEEKQKVLFLGRRADANELLNAADSFILTSEHEGFGISIVEAQANGLPCFVSDAIPHSTKCTELVHFLPTVKDEKRWASSIFNENRVLNREEFSSIIAQGQFSIEHSKDILDKIYEME